MTSVSFCLSQKGYEQNHKESHSSSMWHKTSQLWSYLTQRLISATHRILIEVTEQIQDPICCTIKQKIWQLCQQILKYMSLVLRICKHWKDKLLISEQNKVISLFLPGLDFCFAECLWWENTDVEPSTTACSSKSDSGIVAQPPSRKGKDLHVVFL